MTSPSDPLLEIRQRRAAITPPPWRWGDWSATFGTPEKQRCHLEHSPEHGEFPAPARLREAEAIEVLPGLEDPLEYYPEHMANAEFIAHAPTDIDWLLGEVTDRRREVDELRGAEAIVRNLAGHTPPVDNSPGLKWCGLCHAKTNGMITDFMLTPERHKRDCPWRLAQEWLAAAIRSTSEEEQP